MHVFYDFQCSVQEVDANCTSANKGVLRMADNHLQFCDGKDWVQLLDKKLNQNQVGREVFCANSSHLTLILCASLG